MSKLIQKWTSVILLRRIILKALPVSALSRVTLYIKQCSVFFVGLSFLLLSIKTAHAQTLEQTLVTPEPRQGYYLSLAPHLIANSNQDKDLGSFKTMKGSAFSIRAGQMTNTWLGFGLQIEFGGAQSKRWRQSFGGLMLETHLVPWKRLAIRSGLGVGYSDAKDNTKQVKERKGTGGGYYSLGVSYDFFPFYNSGSGGFALTPGVYIKYVPGKAFHTWMTWVGCEIVWWTGWDKQELALSETEAYQRDD